MNSVWSQFTRGAVSFLKNVLSKIPDSKAAALAVQALSPKIADWASNLMGFYFSSAIAISVFSIQVHTKLPVMFHLLYLSILLGFYSLLFAEFGRCKSPLPNQILRCISLFFLVLAFLFAISIPFPLYFKLISLAVFLVALSLMFWFATVSSA